MTIDEIRAKYPTPSRLPEDGTDIAKELYCVGGALCMAITPNNLSHFPTECILARSLCLLNPLLTERHALLFAKKIIQANDSSSFSLAWSIAGHALSWQPEEAL